MAARLPSKSSLNPIFQISHNQLRHRNSASDIMISSGSHTATSTQLDPSAKLARVRGKWFLRQKLDEIDWERRYELEPLASSRMR